MLVKLEAELTLTRASEIKPRLMEALAEGGDVELDCSAVTEVDVAGLQLICSLHRSLEAQKRGLRLVGNSDQLQSATKRAAFSGEAACSPSSCLWRKVHG
jgi:anti-anti-sigma regulatory factor